MAPQDEHPSKAERFCGICGWYFVGHSQCSLYQEMRLTAFSANVAGIMRLVFSIRIINGTDLTYLRLQHGMWTYVCSSCTGLILYNVSLTLSLAASPRLQPPSSALRFHWFPNLLPSSVPLVQHSAPAQLMSRPVNPTAGASPLARYAAVTVSSLAYARLINSPGLRASSQREETRDRLFLMPMYRKIDQWESGGLEGKERMRGSERR